MSAIGRDDLGDDPALADNAGRVARVASSTRRSRPGPRSARSTQVLAVLGEARCRPAGSTPSRTSPKTRTTGRATCCSRPHARRQHARRAGRRAQAARARRARCARRAPRLGDDTDAVLRELGLSAAAHRRAARQEGGGMNTIGNGAGHGASTCRKSARATACRSSRPSCRPTTRSRWSTRCREAGMAKIEVTSFVSPKAIPALRDAEIVLREIEREPGVDLQRAGAQRARRRARDRRARRRVQPRDVGQRDAQPRQPAHDARAVVRRAVARSSRWRARPACRSTCRCRAPSAARWKATCRRPTVLDWCARFVDELGVRGVTLCDTTGMAYPTQVAALTARLPRALARHRADAALPQHARHGPGQRAGGDRRRRRPLRRLARRHRRLPLRAGRHRQRVQRGDRARAAS